MQAQVSIHLYVHVDKPTSLWRPNQAIALLYYIIPTHKNTKFTAKTQIHIVMRQQPAAGDISTCGE